MMIKKLAPLFDTLEHLKDTIHNVTVDDNRRPELMLSANFLLSYRGSDATYNSYRREIERLLQWSWLVRETSALVLRRADIESYIEFCQNPPKSWVAKKQVRRFIQKDGLRSPNPEWKPFTLSKISQSTNESHTLSSKALQAVFAVLSSFYNYLIQEDAITYNPVAQIRQKSRFIRKQQHSTVVRRLSELQWSYVLDTAEKMADNNPQHERTLFIINALYGMYLRISELTASARWQPQMGDFYIDGDQNWWFKTVGKGNKERVISVSDAMLNALTRYRTHLGLSRQPTRGETTPLIQQLNNKKPISSTRQIRNIVQTCFDKTMAKLLQDGLPDEVDALQAATVHWLRHTGISDDVKFRSP